MKVSIAMVVRNEAGYIDKCLKAVFAQTFQDFEIVIVDHGSKDGTAETIRSFDDGRIKYIYEPSDCGIAELRNIGLRIASGEFIFFTDGDCVPEKNWLEYGLRALEKSGCAAVQGKTYYESLQAVTISDYNTYQFVAEQYMTCNMAYRREALEKANYFDPSFRYGLEDYDLALRVIKSGKIEFVPDMLVGHQKKLFTPMGILKRARRAEDKVRVIKRHGWAGEASRGILYPRKLLVILCPPIILLTERYASGRDLIIGLFKYLSYIYERIVIWKSAIKERILVV